MRPGLAEYDLASLLFDPYITLSPAEGEELLAAYEGKRNAALSPVAEEFREILRLCGIQRLMQALGAYGLTQALLQIQFGTASDRIGRKPVIVVGLLIFAVGSVVAASSASIIGA